MSMEQASAGKAGGLSLQTQAYFLARPEVKAQFKRVLEGYRESTARPLEPAAPP